MNKVPFVVALTGGIASGKSVVSAYFADLGATVVDADIVARELVQPGGGALAQIIAEFGRDVLTSDGALDRGRMRERIFKSASDRRRLEAILHPAVRAEIRRRVMMPVQLYALTVIPLLVESAAYEWVDRVLVVDTTRATQRARLLTRERITPVLADSMLDAQASREQRLAIADDVLSNDGTVDELRAKVLILHRRYIRLADGLPDD
ncbi:MAG: dephospho-CoA kinase [Dokdonella sp.]|uniref:dephospho-CoA kinase n=1 Tax=Dokdonella sp. TaxID=2291710 RepID=UPI0032630822